MKKALTDLEAEEARILRAKGFSFPEIGRMMGISKSTTESAVKRMGAYRGGRIDGEKK